MAQNKWVALGLLNHQWSYGALLVTAGGLTLIESTNPWTPQDFFEVKFHPRDLPRDRNRAHVRPWCSTLALDDCLIVF